jgi:hypothetical protein
MVEFEEDTPDGLTFHKATNDHFNRDLEKAHDKNVKMKQRMQQKFIFKADPVDITLARNRQKVDNYDESSNLNLKGARMNTEQSNAFDGVTMQRDSFQVLEEERKANKRRKKGKNKGDNASMFSENYKATEGMNVQDPF